MKKIIVLSTVILTIQSCFLTGCNKNNNDSKSDSSEIIYTTTTVENQSEYNITDNSTESESLIDLPEIPIDEDSNSQTFYGNTNLPENENVSEIQSTTANQSKTTTKSSTENSTKKTLTSSRAQITTTKETTSEQSKQTTTTAKSSDTKSTTTTKTKETTIIKANGGIELPEVDFWGNYVFRNI